MSILSGLFTNPAVKKAAFGMIIKMIKENNLTMVALTLDANDEIVVTPYKDTVIVVEAAPFENINPSESFVVLGKSDFEELVRLAKLSSEPLKTITHEPI